MDWGSIAGGGISALGSLVGGAVSATNSRKVAAMNIKAQKEFAQNGIQWKVNDAKQAGIHPLAALGAQTTSFTPSYVGDGMGEAIANMGQNLGRAVESTMNAKQRKDAESLRQFMEFNKFDAEMQNLNARTKLLEAQTANQLKQASIMSQPKNPPFPMVNGDPYLIDGQPMSAVQGMPVQKGYQFVQNPDNTVSMLPSDNLTQAWENADFFGVNVPALYWWGKHKIFEPLSRSINSQWSAEYKKNYPHFYR